MPNAAHIKSKPQKHTLRPLNTPNHPLQPRQHLLLLPNSLPPPLLRNPQLLLQLPNHSLLILLTVLQPREHRDQVLDLLLLQYQVLRQFFLPSFEFGCGVGVNCFRAVSLAQDLEAEAGERYYLVLGWQLRFLSCLRGSCLLRSVPRGCGVCGRSRGTRRIGLPAGLN